MKSLLGMAGIALIANCTNCTAIGSLITIGCFVLVGIVGFVVTR